LYIPAIGGFVLIARAFFGVRDRIRQPARRGGWELIALAGVALLAWCTVNHLPVWKDDVTLWEATTPTCMTSAYCHLQLGEVLLRNGQLQRGGEELELAVRLQPAPLYLIHLGNALTLNARNYQGAIRIYQKAIQTARAWGPTRGEPFLTPEFYANLARAYIMAGDLPQAAQALRTGAKLNPLVPALWAVNAFLQWRQGRYEEARRSVRNLSALTGQTNDLGGGLLYQFWGNASDVGQLLADLRSQQTGPGPGSAR
jgi:tetratricopeptide (TPR) repeat protein